MRIITLSNVSALHSNLPDAVASSAVNHLIYLLHDIWEKRDSLGFYLLDSTGIAQLSNAFEKHKKSQTPYIPPRIWNYQLSRLRKCIDEFIIHQDAIEACYMYCLEAYANNCGSLVAPPNSPLRQSLEYQIISVENALHVIS